MKQKWIIINIGAFGYHIDTYEYCRKLADKFEIQYVCIDNGEKKMPMNGVSVTYISRKWPRLIRGFLFLIKSIQKCLFFKGKIFVVYNETAWLLKRIVFYKTMHLDIRTLAVTSDNKFNQKWNSRLINTIPLYDSVSFISEGIREKVLPPNQVRPSYILPLGTNLHKCEKRNVDGLSLLYVGTFFNRHIEITISGIRLFLNNHPEMEKEMKYTIVGDGEGKQKIIEAITKNNLSHIVSMTGYVPHDDLNRYMESANIGVSYIPVTDYFNYQPPTKTFEYIGAGLFCIATKTSANGEIVNDVNGVLIDDTPEGVCYGLEVAHSKLEKLDTHKIQESIKNYTWDSIVNNILLQILQ